MKKKKEDPSLDKLVKLTKLLKQDKVKLTQQRTMRFNNKWRSQDPKFAPKPKKSENVVQAGGMDVDPSLKDSYEQWRQDKIAEQKERRAQIERKWEAEKKARAEARRLADPDANPS